MSAIAHRHRGLLEDMEKAAKLKADAAKAETDEIDTYRANLAAFEAEVPILDAEWPQSFEYDLDRVTRAIAMFRNTVVGPDVKRCFESSGWIDTFDEHYPCDLTKPYIIRVFLNHGPVPWVEIKRVGIYLYAKGGQPLECWNRMWLGPNGVMLGEYAYQMSDCVLHKCGVLRYNIPAAAVAPDAPNDDAADHKDKRVRRNQPKRKGQK